MKKIHKEIILVFLRMGTVAFGGPAAHTAMMEEELVSKREWMTKKEFLDLMGFTNLIPGPNSTELAILIGYKMGGRLGLFLAGASFILPAMLIVMAIGFFYRSFGHLPAIQNVFAFIQPVVVAIIAQALWKLSRNALKGIPTYLVLFLGLGLLLTGLNEISTLLICGAAYRLLNKFSESWKSNFAIEPMSLGLLFLTFLKIGSFLYGSGYILIAFLQAEFVENYQILTQSQLLDAVAVGEFTPGPVFTTATFIGTLLHGVPGGILGTIAIFLPAFLLIFFLGPLFGKIQESQFLSVVLRGVSIGSLALMASVTFQLALTSLASLLALLIFVVTLFGLLKLKIPSYWFILGALVLGIIF